MIEWLGLRQANTPIKITPAIDPDYDDLLKP
jgi:hypothetical protein